MAVTTQVIATVQGRMQGMGYRVACVQHTRLLGLRGWVRSRRDGTAKVSLAGLEANVLSTRERMWGGPDNTQVTQLDVVTGDHETPVPGFKICPTVQFWATNGHRVDTKRGQPAAPRCNENRTQPGWHCPHRSRWQTACAGCSARPSERSNAHWWKKGDCTGRPFFR